VRNNFSRVLEDSAWMNKRVEVRVNSLRMGGGRRPHGNLLSMTKLLGTPRARRRAAVTN
jgi:hypothetical protein